MEYSEAEKKWGYEFPDELERIARLEPNQGVLINNQPVSLPWPPLSDLEISSAYDIAADWNLRSSFIPIMGDFHDLVCLDYAESSHPEVVIINDNRQVLIRYKSLNCFFRSLVIIQDEKLDSNGVIEEESWLDF
jgi:hypothetical protein